ncbi:Uncharacterised protein [Acinetobacter baumannii]|nr:Uncharacterised protein [Acinetobacter baumannii]SST14707.1 Uncharacterised protein [Acinetobacter baumannii]
MPLCVHLCFHWQMVLSKKFMMQCVKPELARSI